jgi:hypothetical protein
MRAPWQNHGCAVLSLRHLADAVFAVLAAAVVGELLNGVRGVVPAAELLTVRHIGLDHGEGGLGARDWLDGLAAFGALTDSTVVTSLAAADFLVDLVGCIVCVLHPVRP